MKTLLLMLLAVLPAKASEGVSAQTFNRPAQAVVLNSDVDVSAFERFSFQVTFTSATLAAAPISDGAYSSSTFIVVSTQQLRGFSSSFTITVDNAFIMENTSITINGKRFIQGTDWSRYANSSTVTARNLASVIDSWNSEYQATASSNVVLVQANSTGTLANSWTVRSSSRTALIISGGRSGGQGTVNESSSTFSGGQAFGYLSINGTTLTEGTDFQAITSTDTTATNIVNAINLNSTLGPLVFARKTLTGQFTVRASSTGVYAYPVSVSSTSGITADFYSLARGSATEVDVTTNTFYKVAHGFSTGLQVVLSTSANKVLYGLTFGTTYFAVPYPPISANYFRIATSSMNAINNITVDVSSVTGGDKLTFTPVPFAGGGHTGFKWQGSNDGAIWLDVATSSFPYSVAGSTVTTFLNYGQKWIRMKFAPPSTGGVDMTGTFNGRR